MGQAGVGGSDGTCSVPGSATDSCARLDVRGAFGRQIDGALKASEAAYKDDPEA
jgi:hypothetical protein